MTDDRRKPPLSPRDPALSPDRPQRKRRRLDLVDIIANGGRSLDHQDECDDPDCEECRPNE